MTIFLIGYMASGKTTLGKALARAIGYDFIDLDRYIEQRFRKKISEIFAFEGEEGFRKKEYAMLHEAGEFCNTIVSCGGGTPCFFDNMEFMNSRGVTLCLNASLECTVRRLLCAKNKRPIVEGKTADELPSFISTHLKDRAPFYNKAHYQIDSDLIENRPDIEIKVNEIRTLLNI